MALKASSAGTAPVHRTPNDYTADMQSAPQWVKNMQERITAAKYSPYTTFGGSASWNRYQDDYEKVQHWKTKDTERQYLGDYLIKKR
ncbi:MAG: hypothetical protein U1E65_02165 [Myxococcota bacterium]